MISPGVLNSLNVAYRGLMAAQVGLDVVNHNISNANTEGYSRQRVTFQASPAFTNPSMTNTLQGGQIGMGVQLEGVLRVKNQYLDTQIQKQSGFNGYFNEAAETLDQLEDILGATTGNSINDSIQDLFDSFQELSLNPESIPARNAVLQQAEQLLTQFQSKGQLIADLQKSLVGDATNAASISSSKLSTMVSTVNTKLTELAAINGEIITITGAGGVPNDLYDQRDLLLEEISQYVDFDASIGANGVVDVSIAGQSMVAGRKLNDTLEVIANAGPSPAPESVPSIVRTVNGTHDILNTAAPNAITTGSIKAIVDVSGAKTTETNLYGTLTNLDTLLKTIASEVNTLQTGGRDLNGNAVTANLFLPQPAPAGIQIFNFSVNPAVQAAPNLIAAASNPFLGSGDGSNALAMAQLASKSNTALNGNTFTGFFNGMSSKLGVDSNAQKSRAENTGQILSSLDASRQQVSGVNMDEEMVNLIQFQRSFEAASRVISTVDEMLQTIINMV